MQLPAYFDEKRYSYHVLRRPVPYFTDYQTADPAQAFEKQVQQLYGAAYDQLKQQKFAGALDAFRQLQNVILTTVHPTLPPTSWYFPWFVAPLDVALVDVLAQKTVAVLNKQPITTFTFPAAFAGDGVALAPDVVKRLAPSESVGLRVSAQQQTVRDAVSKATVAVDGGDFRAAAVNFKGALDVLPPDATEMRAALTHDLAIANEKAGAGGAASIKLVQNSVDLFAQAKNVDAQAQTLTTLAGMQARAGDAVGSGKTVAAVQALHVQQRLGKVQADPASLAPAAAAPVAMDVASVTNVAPQFLANVFLAKAPPERSFTINGDKAAVTLQLSGDAVKNARSFLGTISDSVDLGIVFAPLQETQVVAYLPAMYFYTIPMAIGDCLLGLGNLEDAAASYASTLVYPFINKAFEIPKLWTKLATVYLEMGDRDYKTAGDDPTAFGIARTSYEKIVHADGTLPPSPLYADARFASIKARVTAFVQANYAAAHPDNPEVLSKVQEAHVKLMQLGAGLDYYGHKPDFLPPFGWEYLQSTAKYFAQQASQMEQRYIQYTASGEQETLQRMQLDQQAEVAAQTVVLEQRGMNDAQRSVDVANATLNASVVQRDNAQQAQADFANNRNALADLAELEAWANAQSVGANDEVKLKVDNHAYYSTDSKRRSWVIQELERARTRISQDLEAARLQRDANAANAYIGQAQAQVAEAQARVAIAQQRIALAQLQQRDAEENRHYLDTKELNARLWFDLARNARRISQRYTEMATGIARLAERAYNAETARNLHIIKNDYTHSATDNLMGADFLALDLDFFTYDYITSTKTKKLPVKRVISLADLYPVSFGALRASGRCTFGTELAMFDRQTPGMYLCKVRNIELVFVGVTRTGLAGTLRNVGASRFRLPDGTVATRYYPADVMALSAYDVRGDALAYRVNPNDLQLFENHGIDTLWQIDLPLAANDFDLASILDVQLVLYYDGFFDPFLETKIAAALPKNGTATRTVSMRLTFPDELFFLKGRGEGQLPIDDSLFPRTQKNIVRKTTSLRATGDPAVAHGLTLHVASAALGKTFVVKTDAKTGAVDLPALNGKPAFDTLTITIKPEDNPTLVQAQKLTLDGLSDVQTYVEYTFDYR